MFVDMKETSKIFKQMGSRVNIVAIKKSQRGIIARRYMSKMDNFELSEFEKSLPQIKLNPGIPVKVGGRIVSYL